MEKYGFVYIWRDRKHKRYYIGCHYGSINDGYLCSSRWMRASYKRRPEDFKRRILRTNLLSRVELLEEEFKWLSLIKEDELGKKYYNLQNHKFNHWSNDKFKNETISNKLKNRIVSEETKHKISEGNKGKIRSEEFKKIQSELNKGEKNHFFGKTHSEETIKKMKEAKLGEKHHLFGKTHSEETKKKMSISSKEKNKERIQTKEEKIQRSKSNLGKHNLGIPRSQEIKDKVSFSLKGNKNRIGKKHSEETKRKISETKRLKSLTLFKKADIVCRL